MSRTRTQFHIANNCLLMLVTNPDVIIDSRLCVSISAGNGDTPAGCSVPSFTAVPSRGKCQALALHGVQMPHTVSEDILSTPLFPPAGRKRLNLFPKLSLFRFSRFVRSLTQHHQTKKDASLFFSSLI